VVLAWDAAAHRLSDARCGSNLVMHEFAHQLDSEGGPADGTPVLAGTSGYAEWARVFHREFEALRRRVRRSREDVMDSYGAANPAEFFAVATEAFFERSRDLRLRHPALYRQLQGYYRLDPAEWEDGARSARGPDRSDGDS
jgi:MtfA peptidase